MITILQYFNIIFKSAKQTCIIIFLLLADVLTAQTVDFSYEIDNKCAPTVVFFKNNSTMNAGYKFLWNFGKGGEVYSSEINLEEAYSDAGTYTVTLKLINGTDTLKTSKTIIIAKSPVASFNASVIKGCAPLNVVFSNNSTQGDAAITEFFWDFRDGDTSNGSTVSYTYNTSGNYDIYFHITDNNGCTSYIESKELIHVFPKPRVSFTASDNFACSPPLLVNFLNKSSGTGSLTSRWNFGNGSTSNAFSPSTVYNSSGSYNVTLGITDANNCTDSVTKHSYINIGSSGGEIYAASNNSRITEDYAVICPGTITFGTTMAPKSDYTWKIAYKNTLHTFTDDSIVEFTAPDSGRIDIKLIYGLSSPCPDSIEKTFIVDYLKADFNFDKQYFCQLPLQVNLISTSSNAGSVSWILPDSSTSVGNNISYEIASALNYAQIYNHNVNELEYPFTLIATSINGCRDTITKSLDGILPVARFMPDVTSGCLPLEVNFSDSSQSVEPINQWKYIINGSVISSTTSGNLNYTFNEAGTYDVKLVITNNLGCADTSYTVQIKVGSNIVPSFTISPDNLCNGDTLWLDGNSAGMGNINSWSYFSDNIFSTGTISTPDTFVIIRSTQTGLQDVHLRVNYNGCVSDRINSNAFNLNGPVGSFKDTFSCANPLKYTFISEVESASSLVWNINGSIYTNIDTVNYTFPKPGDYPVNLKAYGSTGCELNKTRIIKVRNVDAKFDIEKRIICLNGETALFDASGSQDYIDSCYNEGFLWDFGDNTPRRRNWSTIQEHAYADTGDFKVTLVVKADNNCVDTITDSIKVANPPVSFDLSPETGCGPSLNVNLTYTDIYPTIQKWTWIFADNTRDESQSISINHVYYSSYNSMILYTGLMVEDIYGCTNILFKPTTISNPSAEFQALKNSICLGQAANIILSDSTITSYTVDFGDGSSPSATLTHTYNAPGEYDITVTVQKDSCSATLKKPDFITVEQANAAYTVSDSVFNCYPAAVTFNYTGNQTVATGRWRFEPGVFSNDFSNSDVYTYTRPGTYLTALIITTINGCRAESYKTITVTGPYADYAFTPRAICYGDEVSFTLNNLQDVDEFRWIFGDGTTSTENSPTHTYFAKGEIFPALYLRNATCEVTLSEQPLNVSQVSADFRLSGDRTEFCNYSQLYATNRSSYFTSSAWSINDDTVASTRNLGYILSDTGTVAVSLIVTDDYNCTDTLTKYITVSPGPDFNINGDSVLCQGTTGTLSVTPQIGWEINWSPGNTVSDSTAFSISVSPTENASYKAVITSEDGCWSFRDINVHVIESSTVSRIPVEDTTIYIGESVQLLINSSIDNATYNWSPDYRISCHSCNNPVVSPEHDQVYSVTVKDECFEGSYEFPVIVIIDFYLVLPDAFTPNGDGINDTYHCESKNIAEFEFKIYNRWGNLVFSSSDINDGWDGTVNGKLQNSDTYMYYIKAVSEHGYPIERKGSFMLIR